MNYNITIFLLRYLVTKLLDLPQGDACIPRKAYSPVSVNRIGSSDGLATMSNVANTNMLDISDVFCLWFLPQRYRNRGGSIDIDLSRHISGSLQLIVFHLTVGPVVDRSWETKLTFYTCRLMGNQSGWNR